VKTEELSRKPKAQLRPSIRRGATDGRYRHREVIRGRGSQQHGEGFEGDRGRGLVNAAMDAEQWKFESAPTEQRNYGIRFQPQTRPKPERSSPRPEMRQQQANSMTIGKKLYLSFGAVLVMVVVLFAVNLAAVYREHSAKGGCIEPCNWRTPPTRSVSDDAESPLSTRYLLSGRQPRSDHVNDGVHTWWTAYRAQWPSPARATARCVGESTADRAELGGTSPAPHAKRKEVDQGNSTVAGYNFYLRKMPAHGETPLNILTWRTRKTACWRSGAE
jgi:hypothetical protein